MIDRRALLLSLAAIFAGHPAAAAESPEALIAAIYKRIVASYDPATSNTENGAFTWRKTKDRHRYYSASLAKAWDRADAITAKGDQNPPAACPITNSQDPLVRAFSIAIARRDAASATIVARIAQNPGPIAPDDGSTIHYDMVFERGRWRLDDIRPGGGKAEWSLRREIVNHKG